ncbi:PAS fold-containing protein [Pseudonocardia ammonioxydans]|uniref:PAS fold-containing protein n=1 Tax=Pseudonocardia ammonioxydans TaxID=260086 RepID=A0A1I4XMW2_PSUAM|nr:ANTAR domain-containing protein [Pseudonocardia ammonioxydans]SFN27132.1 PAS fold-containing protein [Pseudonocardia ammonioxydans]
MSAGASEGRALRAAHEGPLFHATRSSYVVLDRELRIQAATPAWYTATLRERDEVEGRHVFDVFPDNPGLPGADGVARFRASLLRVLRGGRRDHMGLQRYDVPGPRGSDEFVERRWVAVNSPVHDPDERLVGLLVHVENVTAVLGGGAHDPASATDPAGPADPPDADLDADTGLDGFSTAALLREVDSENARLRRRFERHVAIEQAKGALMARYGWTAAQAFDHLRERSQTTNTKLWRVAEAVLGAVARPPQP